MSILVSSVTKIYGTQKALDTVSIDIKPGEIVGLLGPNGAGKSTLMKILTCYLPPSSGIASVCGHDVQEESIEVRRKVGYLPENNPLYTDLYVREFLRFVAGTHHMKGNIGKRVDEMIELTGLGLEQHKKIGALSKGYRQRVGLAQALIHDPEVLILDEPTSGLDPNQLLEIRNLIRQTGKSKTVMMSTHIMQEVEAICNRVIIIHNGRIIADDTTQNLQRLASQRVVIKVEFSSPVDGEKLMALPGLEEAYRPEEEKKSAATGPRNKTGRSAGSSRIWHLVSAPETDIRGDIFRFAVDHHLTVLSLHKEEQKLEEVFQELTRN